MLVYSKPFQPSVNQHSSLLGPLIGWHTPHYKDQTMVDIVPCAERSSLFCKSYAKRFMKLGTGWIWLSFKRPFFEHLNLILSNWFESIQRNKRLKIKMFSTIRCIDGIVCIWGGLAKVVGIDVAAVDEMPLLLVLIWL